MSFIDLLRKIGILRFGAKTGTYTSAKDMPAEFLMGGVFNANKELLSKQDVKNAVRAVAGRDPGPDGACPKCGDMLKPDARFCSSCGAPCAQAPIRKCAACGVGIKSGARFCAGCGAPVKGAVAAGKKGCMAAALVALGVLGIIIVLGIIGSSGDGKQRELKGAAPTAVPVSSRPGMEPPGLTAPVPETPAGAGSAAAKNSPAVDLQAWKPKSGEEAAAGPAGLKYEKYVNRKFGFVAELPAHWESEVKNNTHIFCGPQGAEDYNATVNFQIITRKPGSTLQSEADAMLSQLKTMMGAVKLDKSDQGDLNGSPALYMVVSYETPGGRAFRQMQAIIDREPYYYMIGYTAPQNLFMKYYFVMIHLVGAFQFTEIAK